MYVNSLDIYLWVFRKVKVGLIISVRILPNKICFSTSFLWNGYGYERETFNMYGPQPQVLHITLTS